MCSATANWLATEEATVCAAEFRTIMAFLLGGAPAVATNPRLALLWKMASANLG